MEEPKITETDAVTEATTTSNGITTQEPQTPAESKVQNPPRPLPAPPALSFAERNDRRLRNKRSSHEPVPEGSAHSFAVTTGDKTPGEQRPLGPRPRPRKRLSKTELGRSLSLSSEDVFRTRDPCPAQDYAKNESMVLAEVQTNVIVNDEFTFITELADQLSKRYNRLPSSITVTLQHGMCLFLGGSFDPAYVVAITAHHSQIQPATNKRNLTLLQKHLGEALRVPAVRGYVRFVPVAEDCCGRDSRTVAAVMAGLADGELIETEAEKGQHRRGIKTLSLRRSIPSFSRPRGQTSKDNTIAAEDTSTAATTAETKPQSPMQSAPEDVVVDDAAKIRRLKSKKSFIHTILQRYGRQVDERSKAVEEMTPSPQDTSTEEQR